MLQIQEGLNTIANLQSTRAHQITHVLDTLAHAGTVAPNSMPLSTALSEYEVYYFCTCGYVLTL